MVRILKCLALLDASPAHEHLASLLASSQATLARVSPGQLVELLWALAVMQHPPPRLWLAQYEQVGF